MMRKLMAILMTLIVLPFSLSSNAFAEADGFRGLKWGTEFSMVKDTMNYLRTDPSYGGIKLYSKKDDDLKIGGAELESIIYGFWQDKFYSVRIKCKGYSNFSSLKNAIFEKYGAGNKINIFVESYFLFGDTTGWNLEYNEVLNSGDLYMFSHEVSKQAKSYNAENVKK